MKLRSLFCFSAVFTGAAFAQTEQTKNPFAEVMVLKEDLAVALIQNDTKPVQAIAKLRAYGSPSGLKVNSEADFAMAAIDLGLRLVAADRAATAEDFFQVAEKSLVIAIQKTKEESAQEKALYLQQLAFIRNNFLNKRAAAGADLDAAIRLQPDDQYLQKLKAALSRSSVAKE